MQCPLDHTELVITERQGIEIDYCPKCRGVWLDRGELDKLVERAANSHGDQRGGSSRYVGEDVPHVGRERSYDDDDEYEHRGKKDHHARPHKREGFLGDLFDF